MSPACTDSRMGICLHVAPVPETHIKHEEQAADPRFSVITQLSAYRPCWSGGCSSYSEMFRSALPELPLTLLQLLPQHSE